MKKILLITLFLVGIFGIFGKKILAVDDYYCLQPGDPCCWSMTSGAYCENGLKCGKDGFCTNEMVSECGKIDQVCCPGRTCNGELLECVDDFCKKKSGGLEPHTFDIKNLTEYPEGSKLDFKDGNLGGIVSFIIKIVYWLAGLSMMAMIIAGGLQVMTSLGIPEKMKMGYGKITGGIVGFLIIFSSYMIVKLIEAMFNIKIF